MQSDRFTVQADTPVLARPPINVVDFGAVGDGSHNDGPAFQGATDFAATSGRKTIVIPSSPAGYSIATTVSVTKPGQWGLRWVGEGGRPIGAVNSTTTLWCDVQEKHGSKASIGEVGFVGSGGTYYTVRVDGLEGQLTDADVGKFLRLVGSAKNGNDGRFMIVKRLDDSSCLIFKPLEQNTQPVADDPNKGQIDWRVEECAFDVRARENIFEHLTFMVRPGQTITRMVNVTESPEPDSNVTGHVKFTDCYFTSRLIQGANARWGVTLAELFLPKPKKTNYEEENGVPRPAMPANCDFISFLDCGFDGLQEAGVAHCNTSAGRTGGGQSREHLFFRSEFLHMPFGYYMLPGSFGMARFEQCTWDTISDTGVVLRNGVNVLTISGGLTEECARLVDYAGTGGAPNPVVIEDIAFGLSHGFVHPSNEIMTFGGLGPFLFKNVLINTTDAATPFISLTAPAGSGEGLLTVMSCQFAGDQHSLRPGGHGRLLAPRQGPFPLAEGMTLVIESSFNGDLETVTFHNGTHPDQKTPFFVNGIARATAKEVAAMINTQLTLNKVRAFGTGDNLLALESTTPGDDTNDALFRVSTPPSGGPPGGSANTVFEFRTNPTNDTYTVGWPQSDLAKLTGGFFDTDRGNPERRVVLIGNGQFHSSPLPARPDPFEDGIFHLGGTGRIPHGFSTRNLSGSVQITHPQTSARVQFTRAELDAAYLPTVSAGPSVGTPAPGALRTSWANRTPDGFDINLEAPPGSDQTTPNVVQVIWHLLR
jgi:hypothetical protein